MSMNNIDQAYAIAIQAGIPVILWGSPGIGKTKRTYSIARSLGYSVIEQVCSSWDPTDVGLPVVKTNYFERIPPKWAIDCTEACASGKAILFLDELTCSPPAIMAPTLKIVDERKCGDYQMPLSLGMSMAANPPEQAAGGWDLPAASANRICHLDVAVNVEEWCDGMIAGFPDQKAEKLPSNWRSSIPATVGLVTSYMRRQPGHLNAMPEDEASRSKAWPSNRSWDFLCQLLAAAESIKAPPAVVAHLVKGMIGHPAVSFMSFCENLDLPDPELLLADPSLYEHPARGDKAHAILGSVAAAALAKPGAKRWEAAVSVMLKAADQGGTDIAAMACRALLSDGNMPPKANVPDAITRFFPMFNLAGKM
jgi:hypothetical protein